MKGKKMKALYIFIALISFILFPALSFSQSIIQDTTKTLPTQYRRGVELMNDYQSYEQKYQGKNLLDEKKRLYPLGFETDHLNKMTTGTGIWTELNPGVPRVDYLGIHFVNPDTGWACGDLGTVIKSVDGGQHWTVEQTNTTTPILKVKSYNGQVVIASGFNGLIIRSTDGGETWTQETSGVTGDMWGLQMINDTLGWSCGTGNSLVKTTNGGITWQRVYTPGYTSDYWWVDFMPAPSGNENYGFIAANGKVLRTTDGGSSWDIIQAGDNQALYSVDVIDSLHIAAAGAGGTGYFAKNIYSSDGGSTWINGGSITTDPINCIKYVNTDTGYIVMSETGLYKTTNRGADWQFIAAVYLDQIGEYEIQFLLAGNVGYNVGSSLKLFRSDGNYDNWNRLIINDDFYDVYFTSSQTGYALSGALYKTTNGGESFQQLNGPGGYSMTFTDSLTGYIGASYTKLYKTTNAGSDWYQTTITGIIDTVGWINKFFFINSETGWAVTSRGGIMKTTDGGENWFAQFNGGSYLGFKSIYFIDPIYGWTVWPGYGGIYSTTDGGTNWVERTEIPLYQANDIYFTNADTGWVADDYDGFYETTDAGISWDTLNGIYHPRQFSLFPYTNHFWVYGFSHLYETNNNGFTWQEITPSVQLFSKFSAPLNWLGYGVDGGGYIVKYIDSSFIPVKLISFNAKVNNDIVTLSWITVTETNNKGFEIERLKDYKIKRLKNWEKIGYINGLGTTTEPKSYTFTDNNLSSGTYKYRLKQIDYDGRFKYSKELTVDINNPMKYYLSQNYPNPFNPTTKINFELPEQTNVKIMLYDIIGRDLKTLINKKLDAGFYTIPLKSDNLSSGVYFYRMTTSEGYTAVKKLIILK
jgi:photosystem II stability/assembly factor-like uncharacterized protein